MRELIERRTATAKHYALEGGKRLAQFHIGQIHYQDGPQKNGSWQEIDTELRLHAPTGKLRMTAAGYEAEIGPAGDVRFFNVDHSLEFHLDNPNKVEPVPSDNAWGRLGKGLIWRDILQPGGHMEIQARNGSLAKIFHFATKPKSNEIEFEVRTGGQGQFRKGQVEQGDVWSLTGSLATFGKTQDRLTFIRRPQAWNHRGESIDITLLFFVQGGKTYARKQIPQEFVARTFTEPGAWLETDTTTSFYAGSGDAAYYRQVTNETIATIRAGAQSGVFATWTYLRARYVEASSASYQCQLLYRSCLPFDTSALGAEVSISGATLNLYGYSKANSIDSSTDACISGFSGDGYTNVVWTRMASDILYSSFNATANNVFSLNSAGLANIDVGGTTRFGFITSNDMDSETPGVWQGTGVYNGLEVRSSEYAGTDTDPYLAVTYSPLPLEVTPGAGSAATAVVNPTVVLGSISTTPSAGSAATAKVDPTVAFSSFSMTPAAISAATAVVNPTVVLGSVAITPAAREAATAVVAPTVVYGSVAVTPAPGSAATAKSDPFLHWTSLTMTPAPGSASSAAAGPTVVLGSVAVTPSPGSAATAKVDPVVDMKMWRAIWYNRGPGLLPGDIVMTQRRDYNIAGTGFDVYRAYGNVIAVGTDPVTGKEYANIYVAQGQEYFADYKEDIEWVAVGNTINPARAAVIYMTADEEFSPRIEMRSGVDSFEKFGSMETLRVAIGNLSGIVDSNFGTLTGYGIFTDNAYFKGTLALGSATSMTVGAGLWASKTGDFRVGDHAANKYLSFAVETATFTLGSAVALQWSSVTGAGKPADNATVGANWASNLSGIPIRFADAPTGAGLYVTSSYLGYFNASTWTAYINNSGQWYFAGNATNYVQWNGTAVTLRGNVIMEGGSISWASVTAPDYSQIGGTKPPSNADNTTTTIGANRLTYIDSGGIYTGTLTTAQLNAGAATVLGAVTAGSFNIGSGKFAVTAAGILTAVDGNFTGAINSGSTITGATITGATITGGTIQTATSGQRVVVASNQITFYNSSDANVGSLYGDTGGGGRILLNGKLHVSSSATFGGTVDAGSNMRIGDATIDFLLAPTTQIVASTDGSHSYIDFDCTDIRDAGGNKFWSAGNDGANSGLDADLLDGNHASAFATAGHTHSAISGSFEDANGHFWTVTNGAITAYTP